jgi:hypothetical protein
MTIEIVDIEKLRKINMADGFIGYLIEHVLRGRNLPCLFCLFLSVIINSEINLLL